jgi:DNA-directed RNA polymerase specialized sigma24 family protein
MPNDAATVVSRLDMIIKLLAASLAADKPQRERIRLLSSAGLAPQDIAQALGTTSNTVRVALVGIRKSGRVRRKRRS